MFSITEFIFYNREKSKTDNWLLCLWYTFTCVSAKHLLINYASFKDDI